MAVRCDPYCNLRNPVISSDSDVTFTRVYQVYVWKIKLSGTNTRSFHSSLQAELTEMWALTFKNSVRKNVTNNYQFVKIPLTK